MDDESYNLLTKMDMKHMFPVKLADIMTDELLEVQSRTTKGQFCWVCQPIICQYILNELKAYIVIYLEADSLFYADPEILLKELGDDSVSLVPHSFSPEFDNTETAGEYCVQFNAFKNNEFGHQVLNYWKENCFKYSNKHLTTYPGQTNLDNWTSLFKEVRKILNPGAGVAPWNVNKYKVSVINNQLCVDNSPVVFYHFHQFGWHYNGALSLGYYPFSNAVIKLIYGKYVKELRITENLVHQTDPKFNFRRYYPNETSFKTVSLHAIKKVFNAYVAIFKHKIKKRYNIYPESYFDIH